MDLKVVKYSTLCPLGARLSGPVGEHLENRSVPRRSLLALGKMERIVQVAIRVAKPWRSDFVFKGW
jgi:hypothetical protein